MKQLLLIGLLCLVASCGRPGGGQATQETAASETVRYAAGFRIYLYEDYTSVEVVNPWDTTRLLQRYLLVERERPVPGNLPEGTLLRTPLRNVAVYTAIHASVIDRLGEAEKVSGVCEPEYIAAPGIKERLRAGQIVDLGMAGAPNVERMIDTGTEYIIASPLQNSNYGQAEKLGIPIIEVTDYMEPLPLGRAEWGLFFGLLFDKREEADTIFGETEKRYLALREMAEHATERPTVFSERRYGSQWYVPGSDSYMAQFFKDAGGDYVFSDLSGTGSIPLSYETVFERAIHADMWLIKYNMEGELTYDGLRAEYTPYGNFDAFKKRGIYTCNTGKTLYYEESPIHPDYLLEDLIRLFHPGLLPDAPLRYYRKME